jgi:hypothetical protein
MLLDLTRKSKIIFPKDRNISLTDFCNNVFVSDLIIRTISRTSFIAVPSICCPIAAAFGLLIFV